MTFDRILAGVLATVVLAVAPGCGGSRPAGLADAAFATDAADATGGRDEAATQDAAGRGDGASASGEIELIFEPNLFIANETLVFPPVLDQPSPRTLSEGAPGDVVVAYTRVGCWVDPEGWIGQAGTVRVAVRPVPAVRLASVTIEQRGGVGIAASVAELAKSTCVSARTPGGAWQAFVFAASTEVTIDGDIVRARFDTASTVTDAVAIFLPTYTNIPRISYRAELAP